LKIYLASPFFKEEERANALLATQILRNRGYDVYLPLEHKIYDAWSYSNADWGRLVFENDIAAINDCDCLVCLSYGRESSAGTNFECGYAYGNHKKVVVVVIDGVRLMSLMLANGNTASVVGVESLKEYDFENFPELHDDETEQK
jgi:nucleoside deoxyribosyltransferase